MTALYKGEKVTILSMDADVSCLVWVAMFKNPDIDMFVNRSELSVIA